VNGCVISVVHEAPPLMVRAMRSDPVIAAHMRFESLGETTSACMLPPPVTVPLTLQVSPELRLM
jgi:hypothetical protein